MEQIRPLLILNSTKDNEDIKEVVLKYFPNALTEENPNILMPVGGDGTVLHTAKHEGHRNLPIFGIANGTLNFIPNYENNWDAFFKDLASGDKTLDIEKTFYIDVIVEKANGERIERKAVNDVVLGNGIMDYFHFLINSDDATFSFHKVSSGGLCIASPLGSTAYHYNNGGTIIPSLKIPLLAVTTIVSNRKERINKMLDAKQDLRISIDDEKEARDQCLIFVDGKTEILELNKGDVLNLRQGSKIKFLFSDINKFQIKRLTF